MHSAMTLGRRRLRTVPRSMRGVGLVEVLMAILVLTFGMLGIAAMQATSLRNGQSAMQRSQAVVQSYAILDSMRANPAVAKIGGYNLTTMTCDPPDRADLATNDLADWIEALHEQLGPNACGKIACDGPDCAITVRWSDNGTASGNSTPASVLTETRL